MQRAAENWGFYTGFNQWDKTVINELRAKGKLPLTINLVLNTIHMPAGYQRRNRFDYVLQPKRGGTRPVAELGSALLMHAMDTCGGEYENSDAFLEGLVTGKGWTRVRIDYTKDPMHGDLVIERVPASQVMEDQLNTHYDLNRCDHLFYSEWMTKKTAQLRFNVSEQDLDAATAGDEWVSSRREETITENSNLFDDYDNGPRQRPDSSEAFRLRKYLITETWFKEDRRVKFLCDPQTGRSRRLNKQSFAKFQQISMLMPEMAGQFKIVEQIAPVLYKVTTCGDLVLEYEVDPFKGLTDYPFFRFCPHWADGEIFGIIDNIKDPQREVNKRRSQALHNTNMQGGPQWEVADGSDREAMQHLKTFGNLPGFVLDRSKFGGEVKRLDPPKLDQANLQLAEQGRNEIKEISSVNSDLLGTDPSASESGKARMIRQEAGLMSLEVVFDNFDRTQMHQGTVMWDIIRTHDLYSQAELEQVVTEDSLKSFIRMNPMTGQQVIDISPASDMAIGHYGVKVDKGSKSPTMRMYQYEQLVDAAQKGVILVPPEVLADLGDFPMKDQIIEYTQQQRMAQLPPSAPAGVPA